jgi:hypothetical protein
MNRKTMLLCIAASLLMSGCSTVLETRSVEVQRTKLNLEEPPPISARPTTWKIITPENATEVFADLEKSGADPVLFGLTDDGYENLSKNILDIRNYIIQQRNIIKTYKTYYETEEK